jgi:hypothetical protein
MVVWKQFLAEKNSNRGYDSDRNHTKSHTSSGRLKISYMNVGYLLNKNSLNMEQQTGNSK